MIFAKSDKKYSAVKETLYTVGMVTTQSGIESGVNVSKQLLFILWGYQANCKCSINGQCLANVVTSIELHVQSTSCSKQ